MKNFRHLLLLTFTLFFTVNLFAIEGMWIPMLLEKYNIKDMQERGFKLTAEDIYSINQASMKDAIVIFGRGCTGELISDQGLILTNHHCGYSRIHEHSTLEHDYLTDGFWAMSKEEELPNPGLTVRFLDRMEDVTSLVLANVKESMTQMERQEIIDSVISVITVDAVKETHFNAIIRPFYYGNQYFMFVYEEFTDIRFVGAPPSAIGKFGGDTDNWMWPRHTGDFSLFRVYADKDNKPAEYSEDNVPYKPKKHFPISLNGVDKGDFTLVFGYPGSTEEYIPSYAVELISKVENPHQIKLRDKRLKIIGADMDLDPAIRLKYAAKHAGVANYWKKWIGENRGLKKLNAIEKKQKFEADFTSWVNQDDARKVKYGNLLSQYKKAYKELTPYKLAEDYIWEAAYAVEMINFSRNFREIASLLNEKASDQDISSEIENLKNRARTFFKDYNQPTDRKVFAALLEMYYDNLDTQFHPLFFKEVEEKYNGNFASYADYVYDNTIMSDEIKLNKFLSKPKLSKLTKDPGYQLWRDVNNFYALNIYPFVADYNFQIDSLNRIYMQGIMEFRTDEILYPDANFTLRVTYGNVDDFYPADGVYYEHFTTLEGIMEKDDPDIYDYDVPDRLKELYNAKDYGIYGTDSTLNVCFIASNHTSGGNSGSPVLNAEGHLIGLNFDRNWEGTMSDIMYDPDQCRNISMDIRYTLFLIDKFAGAKHLIDEMTLITE
jgi:Peptidase S46